MTITDSHILAFPIHRDNHPPSAAGLLYNAVNNRKQFLFFLFTFLLEAEISGTSALKPNKHNCAQQSDTTRSQWHLGICVHLPFNKSPASGLSTQW